MLLTFFFVFGLVGFFLDWLGCVYVFSGSAILLTSAYLDPLGRMYRSVAVESVFRPLCVLLYSLVSVQLYFQSRDQHALSCAHPACVVYFRSRPVDVL